MQTASFAQPGSASRPSGSIWAGCLGEELNAQGIGYYFHDDFLGGVVANTSVSGWQLVGTAPILTHIAGAGGILEIGATGTGEGGADNDEGGIHKAAMAKISLNSGKKVRFESRVRINGLGAADIGVVIGLAESAMCAADFIVDDCANLATESFAGFRILDVDTATIDAIYQLDDGAEVSVCADVTNSTALGDDAATLVNTAYYKYGMVFDGKKTLSYYVNGFVVGTVTVTSLFPIDVDLAPLIGIKTGSAAEKVIYTDWVRVAAEY